MHFHVLHYNEKEARHPELAVSVTVARVLNGRVETIRKGLCYNDMCFLQRTLTLLQSVMSVMPVVASHLRGMEHGNIGPHFVSLPRNKFATSSQFQSLKAGTVCHRPISKLWRC